MKIGYNEATGKGCSTLEQDLILCEQAGFDFIEIRLDMLREYLKDHSLSQLRTFFETARLQPHALNAIYTYMELFESEDESQQAFMEEFRFACEAAREIGAGHIIVVPPLHPDRVTPYTDPWEQIRRRCIQIMEQLGTVAAGYDVKLCFELVGAVYSSVQTIGRAKEIIEAVNLPNVGYVFDSYNIYLGGKYEGYRDIQSVEAEKIFAVHINDADDVPEGEMNQDKRCFCGHGVLNLPAYLAALSAAGYRGMVSIETFRPEYWEQSPEWVIKTAYDTTRKVLEANGYLAKENNTARRCTGRILTLESSTTSAKAMLYCSDTGQIDVLTEEYKQEDLIDGNVNPETVFLQTVALGKQLSAGKEIAIIALGSAWHSVFLCDRQMRPLTGVYSWESPVASDICTKKREDQAYVKDYYNRTGCMVNAIYPSFKLMYLKSQGVDLEECLIFGQGSYNTCRLVGQRVVTDCMVSGSGLLNVHAKQYDQATLDEIGIGPRQLSKIVTYDQTFPLTEEGAELLGLKAGIPVIVACSDGGYNQIGVGAQSEGVMSFSVGTSAAIRLTVSKPLLPDPPSTWCYLSPTGWMSGAATSGACNCTEWFKDNYLQGETFQEIEALCDQRIDPPVFLPFVFGERCPGWKDDAKGIFACVQPNHDKYDMYRAVLEGVLFNIYHCYNILKEYNNNLMPRIILSGGILNSPMWTQMCADIFQTDLEIPENEQSSLLGGIVLGMELLGLKDQTAPLFQKNRIVKTNPARHSYYCDKFEQYLFWYNKLI